MPSIQKAARHLHCSGVAIRVALRPAKVTRRKKGLPLFLVGHTMTLRKGGRTTKGGGVGRWRNAGGIASLPTVTSEANADGGARLPISEVRGASARARPRITSRLTTAFLSPSRTRPRLMDATNGLMH